MAGCFEQAIREGFTVADKKKEEEKNDVRVYLDYKKKKERKRFQQKPEAAKVGGGGTIISPSEWLPSVGSLICAVGVCAQDK